ncbi:MAG: glycoside hydrolase [Kiritimatiellae bacterium]|nr:glycoside hydrolase [Kiritimatiellia bacterium]
MNKRVIWIIFCLSLFCIGGVFATDTIDLAGKWRFALDKNDNGINEKWFEKTLDGKLVLPGSLPAQGIGDDVTVETKWTGSIIDRSWFTSPEYEKYRQPGNVKIPFWLQPEKYYVGAAWYQRNIKIPEKWKNRRVVLFLERPHWETRVWMDGNFVGFNNTLATPHEHDLGIMTPGEHRLAIRVDNRMVVDVGENSHSVSDHTQGNWNGIAGRMELQSTPPVCLDDVQIYYEADKKTARVKVNIRNITGKAGHGKLSASEVQDKKSRRQSAVATIRDVSWDEQGGRGEVEVDMSGAKLWDEFTPNLQSLVVTLRDRNDILDERTIQFGMREFAAKGTQFMINRRPVFFRGTLECCIFPKTGHPPTEVSEWKRIIGVVKAHGLNNMRFHSWCPPEAAFVAADELGFYLQVECSSWANTTTGLGIGKPIDTWIYEEADRILKYYGNHPSFMLMLYGNEPGGKHADFLKKWVMHYREKDPRRLYSSGSGWPLIPESQFHVTPAPRIQAWGGGLKSRINARPPETCTDYRDYIQKWTVPCISHEIGEWCVYPNFDEISKYTGYLKPKNFEIFRELLTANHMGKQARSFLLASGKLQALCYKEDIESALRTPGMGGFQLLDLHDFPGQGTALVGVLDPFWESKGYITAKEYSRFCNSTVPLARLVKRVFTTDEKFEADIEVTHFGPVPMENAIADWKLIADNGATVSCGKLPACTIPVGNSITLGRVGIDLKSAPAPVQCKLVVELEKTTFENDWDVWIYPAKANTEVPQGITVVDDWNQNALLTLEAGGKVLLMIPPDRVKGDDKRGKVMLGFSSIFWNTAWTRRQPPETLGILCDPKNPALNGFTTDYHSNWQWWYLVTRAGAMILNDMPANLRPTVQIVDDWFANRKLGLVFEGRVGKGKLLVCSIDLKNDLDNNPVARQMLSSLLNYMAGKKFDPKVQISNKQITDLLVSSK